MKSFFKSDEDGKMYRFQLREKGIEIETYHHAKVVRFIKDGKIEWNGRWVFWSGKSGMDRFPTDLVKHLDRWQKLGTFE